MSETRVIQISYSLPPSVGGGAGSSPFCTENCTFYEEPWSIFPPQNNTIWMIRVNSSSTQVKYDDGLENGSWSIGESSKTSGRGAAIRINPPSTPFNLTSVSVYGRYYCNNTQAYCYALLANQNFSIFILSSNFSYIKGFGYRYIDVFQNTSAWATISLPQGVLINTNPFYVFIDTNSSAPWQKWYSGIYLSYDYSAANISPARSYLMKWESVLPRAWLELNRIFGIYTYNDTVSAGAYTRNIEYGAAIKNTDDASNTVLGNVKSTVSSDNILGISSTWYASRNGNNLSYTFPASDYITEDSWYSLWWLRRFAPETREVKASLTRKVSPEVFSSNGIQEANFTIAFTDSNF